MPPITRPTPAEPTELDEDMTRADLVGTLQQLPFKRGRDRCLIELDRGVRDFLLGVLGDSRHGRPQHP